ncbi:MAG: RNA-binding S4 domain-containing protein [Culicoidibacterales bacterium]
MEILKFKGEYITLAQALKKYGFIGTGGEFHAFCELNEILVDDVSEIRKGRKLYQGMKLTINNVSYTMESQI